jgi:hypothetical protein
MENNIALLICMVIYYKHICQLCEQYQKPHPARGTSFLFPYSAKSLNQVTQYFHMIFLINHLTSRNKIFPNDSLTAEECDQCHCFLTFEINILYILESLASAILHYFFVNCFFANFGFFFCHLKNHSTIT